MRRGTENDKISFAGLPVVRSFVIRSSFKNHHEKSSAERAMIEGGREPSLWLRVGRFRSGGAEQSLYPSGRGSAPAGAGYFYSAIKVAKSAARLASCGWHRSRQNLQLDNSAAISDTAPLERGRRNGKPFLSLRRLNLDIVTAETGVQILPPLTGAYRRRGYWDVLRRLFHPARLYSPDVGNPLRRSLAQWFWLLWP